MFINNVYKELSEELICRASVKTLPLLYESFNLSHPAKSIKQTLPGFSFPEGMILIVINPWPLEDFLFIFCSATLLFSKPMLIISKACSTVLTSIAV